MSVQYHRICTRFIHCFSLRRCSGVLCLLKGNLVCVSYSVSTQGSKLGLVHRLNPFLLSTQDSACMPIFGHFSCRKCAVSINCQLDRHLPSSPYHMPCFSAIAHGYSDIVLLLLNNELDPNHPDVCCEHELVSTAALADLFPIRGPTGSIRDSVFCSLGALEITLKYPYPLQDQVG